MTVVALLEIRRISELVNKARVVEECATKVALARDTRGGNNDRRRGEFFQLRGQNFKRNGHTLHHRMFKVKKNSGGTIMLVFTQQGKVVNATLVECHGTLLRISVMGKTKMRPGQAFALDVSERKESDPSMRGKSVKLLDMLLGRSLA
ncbi:hypothetical protein AHAS_Ahas01G0092200 [Arachis hypogaea]